MNITRLTKKGGTPQIRAVPPMHKVSRLINYHFCRISQNLGTAFDCIIFQIEKAGLGNRPILSSAYSDYFTITFCPFTT